jgi:uncharacterized protein YjiS (DUF1127 family)
MISFVLDAPRAVALPIRILGRCVDRLAAYWCRREAIKMLAQFDDRELRDIGLTRGRIEAAVNGFTQAESELGRMR